jgi:hypothetical protein
MIVKNVNLPKFTVETKTHNAYNRVNVVQNKIKYDPVTIVFHDDQADNVRNFWYDYYSFYYRDSDYADATYSAISKYQSRPTFDWGYSPRPTVGFNSYNGNQPYQYIQAIRIYSLYQKNFSEYQLINPTITSFRHGEHNNGDATGVLQHEMQVQFETVKYLTGYVTQNTVGGFVDLHYDNTPSPINPTAGNDIIDDGSGGYTTASDKITDLATVNPLYGASQPIVINNTLGVGALGSSAGSTGTGLGGIVSSMVNSSSSTSSFGGVSIPSLGSLTSGVPSLQNLQTTAIAGITGIAGASVSRLATGIVGNISATLGSSGSSIVGLAAAAISNPSAALRTVENMALQGALSIGSSLAQKGVDQILNNSTYGILPNLNEYIMQPAVNQITELWNSASDSVSDLLKDKPEIIPMGDLF